MRSRFFLVAVAVALPGLSGVVRAAPDPALASVGLGRPAFWAGTARPGDANGVHTYPIRVAGGGRQLRIGFDHPDFRVFFNLQVLDPDGKQVASGGGWNSAEVRIDKPRAGTWVVKAQVPADYEEFRLRAILDGALKAASSRAVALLPNLQLVPPYELTFNSTLGSLGGFVSVGSGSPSSCTPDDTLEQQSTSCLRFSLGPSNVGAGPMELVFPGEGAGFVTPGQAKQVVHWSDGRTTERAAGEFLYHKTHMHYHHTGFGTLELLRVSDAKHGTFTAVSNGPKQGFCTGDVMIADWFSGRNEPQNSANSGCVAQAAGSGHNDPTGTSMGLSAGWVDLYSWEQDGNYVNWPGGDGHYVIRSTADALGVIQESNENDNTAYTYFRVAGTDITVLERGRGQGPWDRRKVIVRDGLHPLAG